MATDKKCNGNQETGLGLPQGPLYLMTEIVRHREKRLASLLAPLGISLHEWRALRILYGFSGDVSMSDVIVHSQTDRTAFGRTITQLVQRGWVARFPSSEDKRAVYLRVMPESREPFERAWQLVCDYDAQLMTRVDESGQHQLNDVLQKMLGSIDIPERSGSPH